MKGRIEQISEGESKAGQKYLSVTIDGQRYIVWDEKYFDLLQEGALVDYKWKQSGSSNFRKITEIEVLEDESNREEFEAARNRKITRMGCLKYSATLLQNLDIDPDEKVDKAIEVARKFENYVHEDEDIPF